MLFQKSICCAEMFTSEKSSMGGEGRGMRGFEDNVFLCINESFLFLGMASPEEENEEIPLVWESFYDCICEYFPSLSRMRHWFSSSDRESRIEQEHALLWPTREVSAERNRNIEAFIYFFKYISQGWRNFDSFEYGKSETMSLPWSVVWILSEDDDFDWLKRSHIERRKYIFGMWIESFPSEYFTLYELRKFIEIGLFKFFCERNLPITLNLYFFHESLREWRYSSIKLCSERDVSMGFGIWDMLKSQILSIVSLEVLITILP